QRTDDEYLICREDIACLYLKDQQWGRVLVERLQDVTWAENSFRHLKIEQSKKDIIQTLVTRFDSDQDVDFDDAIQGKGRGLIFLLHGDPGLGKTMTAESIAEHAHRPLYHVTTGQLSMDTSDLDRELGDIFMLGHRWGAVVLLDEADVLMSQRTPSDLERNAIVAVFLRLIEHYSGLLFLTTNRVEGFDSAFHNRIHVKIRYPPLDNTARTSIWSNLLLNSNSSIQVDMSLSNELMRILGELTTNWRDIRNIVRLARGLTAGEGGRIISVRHIMTAV
ncbi:P-loop containing nucleoside triphosphate hydrolase protein, partial [Diaporthe sp. PMI_573]